MDWDRIETLFDSALALEPTRRTAFLEQACMDDPWLHQELQAMLSAHERPLRMDAWLTPGEDTLIGRMVGPYRVAEQVGEGGMGRVYRAEREEPFYQRVALKILHPGGMSREHIARFYQERQILARLEHPRIARLLEGGVLEDGRPFFVMDFVEGEPITAYCRRRSARLEERIRLVRDVCDAVHYAHQQLVVHRDLKPSNLFVREDGEVRLLDFGIAKLLDGGDGAAATRTGAAALTPAYAAPEQRQGGAVTTATDVYALGLLLYELLTGARPEGEATKLPSQVLAGMTEPPVPVRAVRGDLDAILMTALQPDPRHRYASAAQLGEDLERHLAGLPIAVRRQARWYRMARFVRRHRAGVALFATLMLALILFAGVTARQAHLLEIERDEARSQKARADRVIGLLVSLFETSNPEHTPGGDTLRLGDFVRQGAAAVLEEVGDDPELGIEMKQVLSQMFFARSQYADAVPLLEQALEARRSLAGEEDTLFAVLWDTRAKLFLEMGQADTARVMLERSVERNRRLFGEKHRYVANALQDLSGLMEEDSTILELLEEARHIREATLPAIHIDHASGLNALAMFHHNRGRCQDAIPLYEHALGMLETLKPANHPSRVSVQSNLASCHTVVGNYAGAEASYRALLALQAPTDGRPTAGYGNLLNNLAAVLAAAGRMEEAREGFAEALEVQVRVYGEAHPRVANSRRNLGLILGHLGQREASDAVMREALAQFVDLHGEGETPTAYVRAQYGWMVWGMGEDDRAIGMTGPALVVLRQKATGRYLADGLVYHAMALETAGRVEEAWSLIQEAVALRRQTEPIGHWRRAEAACALRVIHASGISEPLPEDTEACLASYSSWPMASRRLLQRAEAIGLP